LIALNTPSPVYPSLFAAFWLGVFSTVVVH
jgi:hypothetical protein